MTHKPILTATLVAFALSTTAAPMVMAQDSTSGSTAESAADSAENNTAPLTAESVSDAQIEAFVRVAIALEALRAEYTDKIGNAPTEESQNEFRAEADRVAVQLVEKAKGIGPDEYLKISKLAQEDAALKDRVKAQIEVMREKKAEFEKQQAEAQKAQEAQRASEALKAAQDTAKDTSTTSE